jgi:hypothetical protein
VANPFAPPKEGGESRWLRWLGKGFLGLLIITIVSLVGQAVVVRLGESVNADGSNPRISGPIGHPPVAPTPSATGLERRAQFQASFRDSVIDGVVVWPTSPPVRAAGALKLRGAQADDPCSTKIRLEAMDSAGLLLNRQDRDCIMSSATWPKFGPLHVNNGSKIMRIDLVVLIGDREVVRISCPRSGDCSTR